MTVAMLRGIFWLKSISITICQTDIVVRAYDGLNVRFHTPTSARGLYIIMHVLNYIKSDATTAFN